MTSLPSRPGAPTAGASADLAAPVPPRELQHRVTHDERDYTEQGRLTKDELVAMLPDGWEWSGKRVLDLGCGTGRVLRHFLPEAEVAEFHGCDVHAPTIEWLRANMRMPVELFLTSEHPPLPVPDGHYDLIFAISVFTHITDEWAEWLLEMHRILGRDGVFLCTFLGPGMAHVTRAEPYLEEWSDSRFGMNVLSAGANLDDGGPGVFHSPWWIRAHWGRVFEIEELRPDGFANQAGTGGGIVRMRKRDVDLTPADLREPEPGEPRELEYLRANVEQLRRESFANREELRDYMRRVRRVGGPLVPLYRFAREKLRSRP